MNNKLERLKNLVNERPDDSFTIFALAKEYEKIGDYELALKYYYKIYNNEPSYIGVYYHLAKLLEAENQEVEALKIYQNGIKQAQLVRDNHALAELNSAYQNLQIELDL